MTSFGKKNTMLINKENAKKEISKLKRLLKIQKILKSKEPSDELEKVCLSIQRDFVEKQIKETADYLRRWRVDIEEYMND